MRSVVLALSMLMLVSGCAGSKEKRAPVAPKPADNASATTPKKDDQPLPQIFSPGKVVTVNGSLSYAVLNFPIGTVPPAGRRLDAYRSGVKVGELKINGPQGDENAVADITKGEVKIGDEVRSN